MAKAMKLRTIDKQLGPGGQSVYFVEVITLGSKRLRIEIRSDSYRDQSYAKISLFSGDMWNLTHSILPSLMKTPSGLVSRKRGEGATEQDFADDRAALIRVAKEVLGDDV